MPRKSRSTKRQKHIRWYLWSLVILGVIAFGVLLVIFQSTVSTISSDLTVTQLTNDGVFQVTTLLNRNKNTFSDNITDCWNQKNPFTHCSNLNRILEGNYTLKGERNLKRLDGPYSFNLSKRDEYLIDDDYVQKVSGATLANTQYYQIVRISYPEDLIHVEVETINTLGHSDRQEVDIQAFGPPL